MSLIKDPFYDVIEFTNKKIDKTVKWLCLNTFESLPLDLLENLWLPILPEKYSDFTEKINIHLYLVLHYFSDKNLSLEEYIDGTKLDDIVVPDEWVMNFMFWISDIDGRRFLFEHYIDEVFDWFKKFDRLDYRNNHLDRFISSFSCLGANSTIESFNNIDKYCSTIKEKELIFHIFYVLLWENPTINAEELLDLTFVKFLDFKKEIDWKDISKKNMKSTKEWIILHKVQWKELTDSNLMDCSKLYTSIPNIFFIDRYGENNELMNFLFTAWKKYRPEIISKVDSFKNKAQRIWKDATITQNEFTKYIPEELVFQTKEFVEKTYNTISNMKQIYGILYNYYIVRDFLWEVWDKIYIHRELQQWLFMDRSLSKHNMKMNVDLNDDVYIKLFEDYFKFRWISKAFTWSFHSTEEWVISKPSHGLWERWMYHLDRNSKNGIIKWLLHRKYLKMAISYTKKWLKSKAITFILLSMLFNAIKEKISETDTAKLFQTPELISPLSISPELYSFVISDFHELESISIWLDDLKKAKETQVIISELSELQIALENYNTELEAEEGEETRWSQSRAHEIHDIKLKIEALELELGSAIWNYYSGKYWEKENTFLAKFYDLLYDENLRSTTSFYEYNKISEVK